jgi:MFS family permease
MPSSNRGLGAIFVTIFIDIIGFSLIFTIIPELIRFYLPGLAGTSDAARMDFVSEAFTAWARDSLLPFIQGQDLKPQAAGYAVLTMVGGFLAGIFSLLQFFSSPFWGSVSDRIGRRRTLQITITLNALSYLLWAVAPSFGWFVLSRILSGLFSGNISVATALVADLTDSKGRTRGMGFLGMAIGFGFILGPAFGGLLYRYWNPGGELFHPFSGIALGAAILSLLNLLQMTRSLPDPETRGEGTPRKLLIFELASLKKDVDFKPGYRLGLLLQFIYLIFFVSFEFTLAFYFSFELGFTPGERIGLFLFTGLVLALTQGGFSRRMSGKVSEKSQLILALFLFLVGFGIYSWAGSEAAMSGRSSLSLVGVGFICIGAGIFSPAISALASLTFSEDRQGLGMGIFRSAGAAARALGPFFGGLMYLFGGPALTFVWCGALALLLLPAALNIPDSASSTASD